MTATNTAKYELTGDTVIEGDTTLHRIRALRDIPRYGVKVGDLGGYIETEANFNQYGDAWIGGTAKVHAGARVTGDAWVGGTSWATGPATVIDAHAHVDDHAEVENARVTDHAIICDHASIGDSTVSGRAVLSGHASVWGASTVTDCAVVTGNTCLQEFMEVSGQAIICGTGGTLTIEGGNVTGDARITGSGVLKLTPNDPTITGALHLTPDLHVGDPFDPVHPLC